MTTTLNKPFPIDDDIEVVHTILNQSPLVKDDDQDSHDGSHLSTSQRKRKGATNPSTPDMPTSSGVRTSAVIPPTNHNHSSCPPPPSTLRAKSPLQQASYHKRRKFKTTFRDSSKNANQRGATADDDPHTLPKRHNLQTPAGKNQYDDGYRIPRLSASQYPVPSSPLTPDSPSPPDVRDVLANRQFAAQTGQRTTRQINRQEDEEGSDNEVIDVEGTEHEITRTQKTVDGVGGGESEGIQNNYPNYDNDTRHGEQNGAQGPSTNYVATPSEQHGSQNGLGYDYSAAAAAAAAAADGQAPDQAGAYAHPYAAYPYDPRSYMCYGYYPPYYAMPTMYWPHQNGGQHPTMSIPTTPATAPTTHPLPSSSSSSSFSSSSSAIPDQTTQGALHPLTSTAVAASSMYAAPLMSQPHHALAHVFNANPNVNPNPNLNAISSKTGKLKKRGGGNAQHQQPQPHPKFQPQPQPQQSTAANRVDYISKLHQLVQIGKVRNISFEYSQESGSSDWTCQVGGENHPFGISHFMQAIGTGRSKTLAKQSASEKMLSLLMKL